MLTMSALTEASCRSDLHLACSLSLSVSFVPIACLSNISCLLIASDNVTGPGCDLGCSRMFETACKNIFKHQQQVKLRREMLSP